MEKDYFELILEETKVRIPSIFPLLDDANSKIVSVLKKRKKYFVKSKVKKDVLQSFINNWVNGDIPRIDDDNITEYTKLSREFERMENIIQIFQKTPKNQENLTLLAQIDKNKTLQKNKEKTYNNLKENYQKIIQKLLIYNKIDSFSRFLEIKGALLDACYQMDLNKIDKKLNKMIYNGLKIILNDEEKTADIVDVISQSLQVYIPRSVVFKSQEYIIKSISKKPFIKSIRKNDKKSFINFAPDSEIKKFGFGAFKGCNLTNIYIPASVEEISHFWIDGNVFDQLADIKIDPNNKFFKLYDNKFILTKSDPKSDVFDTLFFTRHDIETVTIPSFVKVIESLTFDKCSRLKNVKVDDFSNLKRIESCAFQFSPIESITLPSCCILNDSWCYEMNDLTNIKVIPWKKQNITLFEDKFILGKTDFFSDDFDVLLFARRDIETAEIPSFIRTIGSYSFYKCKKLKRVLFAPDSQLEIIDKNAFNYSGIEEISIPQHVKEIRKHAFSGCSELKQVEFNENSELKNIFEFSFYNTKIETIKIPSNVKTISYHAFNQCTQLKEFVFNDNSQLVNIECHDFNSCPIEQVTLPPCVNKLGFEWYCDISKISISSSNPYFLYYENMFILGKTCLSSNIFDIILFGHPNVEKVLVPSFVKQISRNAFSGCQKLTSVEFHPDSKLELIQDFAFSSSSLRSISIPSSVTTIQQGAFSNCKKLESVILPNNPKYTVIETDLFGEASSLKCISIPSQVKSINRLAFYNCVKLKIINIPENSKLSSIGKEAFSGCKSLEEIYIPANVIEIKDSAFLNCENLKKVYFSEKSQVQVFSKSSFGYTAIESISIPSSLMYISKFTFISCQNLRLIEISEKSKLHSINENAFGFIFCYSPWKMIITMPKTCKKILSYNSNTFKEDEYSPKEKESIFYF